MYNMKFPRVVVRNNNNLLYFSEMGCMLQISYVAILIDNMEKGILLLQMIGSSVI